MNKDDASNLAIKIILKQYRKALKLGNIPDIDIEDLISEIVESDVV